MKNVFFIAFFSMANLAFSLPTKEQLKQCSILNPRKDLSEALRSRLYLECPEVMTLENKENPFLLFMKAINEGKWAELPLSLTPLEYTSLREADLKAVNLGFGLGFTEKLFNQIDQHPEAFHAQTLRAFLIRNTACLDGDLLEQTAELAPKWVESEADAVETFKILAEEFGKFKANPSSYAACKGGAEENVNLPDSLLMLFRAGFQGRRLPAHLKRKLSDFKKTYDDKAYQDLWNFIESYRGDTYGYESAEESHGR